jgi:uncharacterized membrane protein
MSDVSPSSASVNPSLVPYTHVVYALHACSVVVGIVTTMTIVGNFLFGLPSIVAVIMNYVRQSEARGTWLESHFRWQIRTFWFAFLWSLVAIVVSLPFVLIIIGFAFIYAAFIAIGAWVIYRVVRGWLALRDGKPIGA